MKTSNKLLTALAIICMIVMIGIMTIIRSHATIPNPHPDGTSEDFIITHTEPIVATHFDLGHNNRYFLDSEMEGIKISGPKYAVEALQYINDTDLAFTYSGTPNAAQTELNITIGTKNLPIEKILVTGNALCESDRSLYPITDIEIHGNAVVRKINIEATTANIEVHGNGKATIQVSADKVNANVQGNSDLYFKNESTINRMNVDVGGNASLDAEKVNYLTGRVDGNAKLDVDNVKTEGNVSTSGNGRDKSNYRN